MAAQMQFNTRHTESQILSGSISERNVGDVYGASDTGNVFEIMPDLSAIPYQRTRYKYIQSNLAAVDIHDNGAVVQFSANSRIDDEWARSANVFIYSGEPNTVSINISVHATDQGASSYWSRPKARILRGSDIIGVIDNLVMQQNGAYDGDAVLSGSILDVAPGVNPQYTIEWFDKESRTATLIPEPYSAVTLTAEEL